MLRSWHRCGAQTVEHLREMVLPSPIIIGLHTSGRVQFSQRSTRMYVQSTLDSAAASKVQDSFFEMPF